MMVTSIDQLARSSFESEWAEMRDAAPPRRRTHGGTGAGALAFVKPSPPKAVAGRPGFTRASAPGHNRHRRTDGLRFTTISCAPSVSAGTASPIRNSKEPPFVKHARETLILNNQNQYRNIAVR
jgi:hypothetical protein